MEYLPHTPEDRRAMLEHLGLTSMDALLADIPPEIRLDRPLALPPPRSQLEVFTTARELARQNANFEDYISFLGAGAYDHYIPATVTHLLGRTEFATAYTPYQAELSQGLLQLTYEYQTMICELTGMEVSNASLYDGATALAEAVLMAARIRHRTTVVLSTAVHPHYRQVVRTYLTGTGLTCVEVPATTGTTAPEAIAQLSHDAACVVIQHPNFFGCLEAMADHRAATASRDTLLIAVVDPISLGLLEPPGAYGADIVVGEGQGLGIPASFGGPYLGFFATRQAYVRQIPGRLVGATVDARGQRAFCLTLQTREQHIRRAQATSNICTNQALMALAATAYLMTLGPQGLREVARLCLQKAHYALNQLERLPGYRRTFSAPFFKEFVLTVPTTPEPLLAQLLPHRILGGLPLNRYYPELTRSLLVCVTEKRTKEEIDRFVKTLADC